MKLHELEQGSEQWHALRATHLTASDAAAMMGESKYKSRNQLLHEKKTGQTPPVNPTQQAIFDRGHATEEAARVILELETLEDFPPVVGTEEVDGLPLLASLDGISLDLIFEHKQWNETLAENVRNKVLEASHYFQLEHQLLVFGLSTVLFVVSDGTKNNWEQMVYTSDPSRRAELLAGWKQFYSDLQDYTPEAKQEAVVGNDAEAFPLITYEVQGTLVVSNIADVLPIIKQRAEREMTRTLETDQDFADKEKLNKATKLARERLKKVVDSAQGEFVSFSDFSAVASQIDSVLQKMQAQGEKQVKQAKENKKQKMVAEISVELIEHIKLCNNSISPLDISKIVDTRVDWAAAMKGKRNIESIKGALCDLLAKTKIAIDQTMARIVPNQIYAQEHAKAHAFLFADLAQIINQDVEPFQAVVKLRIDEYDKEQERIVAKRKADEEAKRVADEEKKKADDEAKRKADEEAANKKVEPEPAPTVTAPVEKVQPEKNNGISVTTLADHIAATEKDQLTFTDELAIWAETYNVSNEAMGSLVALLKRYHSGQPATSVRSNCG